MNQRVATRSSRPGASSSRTRSRSEEDGSMRQARPASLGSDVAKATFDVALLCEGKLSQRTCSMNAPGFAAFGLWIHRQGGEQVHACLEATGEYGAALALSLYESAHLVLSPEET